MLWRSELLAVYMDVGLVAVFSDTGLWNLARALGSGERREHSTRIAANVGAIQKSRICVGDTMFLLCIEAGIAYDQMQNGLP